MNTPLRLLYVSGPGDIINTYTNWRDGKDDPREVNVTYSGQFFDLCRDLGAHAIVISTIDSRASLHDGSIAIYHRRIPFAYAGPVLYHLGQLVYGMRIFITALMQRTDILVIARGTHWFLLAPLTWLGVAVVPSLHCVLWPKYGRRSRIQNLLTRWDGWLFRKKAFAIMTASDDIEEQVRAITHDQPKPLVQFLPLYRREAFADMHPPDWHTRPFRILYAGRIEEYKGVYDLLDVARSLHTAGYTDIEFDLCGTGAAFHALKAKTDEAGLAAHFRIQGHCTRDVMRSMYMKAHAVIVPTTTRFIEGFNQVVVESILSGRPVITSSVCPALAYVRDAVVEVPPDDVPAYADAIRRLFEEEEYYEKIQGACSGVQEQFYDLEKSWYAALKHVAVAYTEGRPPHPRSCADAARAELTSR